MVNELFTEKFRPKTLEQIVLPKRIIDIIGGDKPLVNYLFASSTPGMGKTSLAKILSKDYPTLYINVSDESSVDVVRDKITTWCSTTSVMDGGERFKVVILDEMDGASDQFYKAMRGTIEKFAATARFIGTCNYLNKIPEAIQSRFTLVNFESLDKAEEREMLIAMAKRATAILNKLNITIEKEAVLEFIKRNFPDWRKVLNKIQSWHISGIKSVTVDDVKRLNYSFVDIFDMIIKKPDPEANYKYLMSTYSSRVEDVLVSLGSELPDYIRENKPELMVKLPYVLIEVANYQAQRTQVIDPAISMLACCFKLQTIFNS